MPVPIRRHRSRYRPPAETSISVRTLLDLNGGVRSVIPAQQARFEAADQIWCVGNTSLLLKKCVAIVGTRDVSDLGRRRSRKLAHALARAGVVVMSGLARGVDTEALTAAIEAGGNVIAVIGTPVDRAYPAENSTLQEHVYREHLLVSQFAPHQRVFPSNFPERNKLMAALSDATAIIEAGETSGTLHQAVECIRLGRWLFIAKSVLDDPVLQWPNRFRNEATCRALSDTSDILAALGI